MSRKYKDLVGQRFGFWFVESYSTSSRRNAEFVCRCDCGTVKTVLGFTLSNGTSVSCGCNRTEKATKHRLAYHPLYKVWLHMKERCYHKDGDGYANYGGRGIVVCERWQDVSLFIADVINSIGSKPEGDYSLDRIDNEGNYESGNIRWATRQEQALNRRQRRK